MGEKPQEHSAAAAGPVRDTGATGQQGVGVPEQGGQPSNGTGMTPDAEKSKGSAEATAKGAIELGANNGVADDNDEDDDEAEGGTDKKEMLEGKEEAREDSSASIKKQRRSKKKLSDFTPSPSPTLKPTGTSNAAENIVAIPGTSGVAKQVHNNNLLAPAASGTQFKPVKKNQNFLYPQNVSTSTMPNSGRFDGTKQGNSMGNEWLSTELLDAALLTASALNGDTHFLDMFDLDNSNALSSFSVVSNNNHLAEHNSHNNNVANTIANGADSGANHGAHNNTSNSATADLFSDSVPDKMLHLLFQGRNVMDVPKSPQQPVHEPNGGSKNDGAQFPVQHQPSFADRRFQVQSMDQTNETTDPNGNRNGSEFSHSHHYSSLQSAQLPKNNQPPVESPYNASFSSLSMNARPRYASAPPNEVAPMGSVDDSALASSSVEPTGTSSSSSVAQNTGVVLTTNLNNKFKGINQPVIGNEIKIHASSGIKMPKNIMEILETTPLPKSLAIDKFGIPSTSLNVHPMARYLLNYYIEDVADMMTVIPLAKNPWKFIYFPRALMAVGELASLGRTSNARNGLLNALLAVSAFNLQSKFVRGSDEMKYYVDLGIQLRRQANEFVDRCMEEDILSQKYKDVLVAVLSMVTIDVVWGTMSSCKIHLDHCEKIIEKKMLHKKKLSSKAIILHRIFSSLKLIQDSTSLENIQKSEIFLNEKNYKNFLTGSKPSKEQLDELNKDNFQGIFRGSRVKSNRNNNISNLSVNSNENSDDKSYTNGLSTRASSGIPEHESASGFSPGSLNHSKQRNNNNSKRGKYNEKITDNGKVRIEFIVNNEESSLNNEHFDANSDIPAFVDITRTSFKPSKNKLEDKVVSSDAIYGLPNSLILMFGEVIPLTRFKKYHEDHNIILPSFFDELATQLEFKLLTWKLEWTLIMEDENESSIGDSVDEDKRQFISPRHEGIYHHVMSFYHALIIYFYRFIEDVNPMYLLERIEKVLHHLNKIQDILENNKETSYIIPLFWQGFIAGSEAMTLYLQNGFNKWGQDIAQTGIGTYWNARQIMLEIWRRKNHNVKNNSWVDVLRDWKTNVMLT
ncbi:hypothetical protein PMKS-002853 [Pichia membranifaciens]|uniref:Transcription factor domain-containing protein n=1 Tax=Pichia membranifaciens TaxID=4926 RepID=A0A1Q2YIR6_9ASCO|nr:hypothetical protein PMKS-002853 [Pichia membranifaciens]